MKKNVSKENAIIAYKGFNIDFSCRDFLYKVGKEYHIDGDIEVCKKGFHACQNALDVFDHYNMTPYTRYAMVELWGDVDFANDGKKICASDIRIVKEISIEYMVSVGIVKSVLAIGVKENNDTVIASDEELDGICSNYDGARISSCENNAPILSTRGSQDIASSGRNANIYASDIYARISSIGDNTSILSIGDYNRIASSGRETKIDVAGKNTNVSVSALEPIIKSNGSSHSISISGHKSRVISHGDYVNVASTGIAKIYSDGEYAGLYAGWAESKIASIGDNANICINSIRGYVNSCGSDARIMSAENFSTIESTGENALVMSAGHNTKARAKVGSWIVLTEYGNNGKIKCVKAEYVDGERIKGNTLYRLVDGEFVETK